MADTAANIPIDSIQSPPVDLAKPINLSTLKGLTILITGGASGLGAAFARHWATHGANIVIGDRNHKLGESLIADLRTTTRNPNHHFLPLDVTSWPSQVSFFQEAINISPSRGIDCVVANAGVGLPEESSFFENPPDYHTPLAQGKPPPPPPSFKILDVNLTGVLYTTHLAHAYLTLNPGSEKCSLSSNPTEPNTVSRDRHLLLLSSMAGLQPLPTLSVYSISKHAITGLFRNLRITSPIRQGIRVNMLCPYFTATPILGAAGHALLAGGALSEIDDVVEAATRLVADRRIIGRGLAIGPRAGEGDAEKAGFRFDDGEVELGGRVGVGQGRSGVWEVYAHDFEQSDVLVRRVLGVTNLVAGRKGWVGLLRDLAWLFIGEPLGRWWPR